MLKHPKQVKTNIVQRYSKTRREITLTIIAYFLIFTLIAFVSGCTTLVDNKTVPATSSATTQVSPVPQDNTSVKVVDKLRVSYLDVGQGDSILVQIPGGKNVLIDAGDNDQGKKVVSYLQRRGVKRLDAVIWTHSHADHIGGADDVINALDIGQVIMPKETSNTKTFQDLIKALNVKGLKITEAKAGLKIDFGPQVIAQLLAPNSDRYDEINDYSAVLRLTFGQNSFLFEGDAQTLSEQEMIKAGYNLKVDVLKVGHHGSHTSTSPEFLTIVHPDYAVISVGKGNSYGHPASDTLSKLRKAGVKVYRTDESGTIIAESDGKDITIRGERD